MVQKHFVLPRVFIADYRETSIADQKLGITFVCHLTQFYVIHLKKSYLALFHTKQMNARLFAKYIPFGICKLLNEITLFV